jgi:superfamily II DNA or RNA helicase
MTFTLRPDQARALEEARARVEEGHRSILIVGPTGFGKSVLLADIAKRHADLGGRVLAVVHRVELVQQLADVLPASAHVASVQALASRGLPLEPTMMIWDEAHHVMASTWNTILPEDGLVLGFTATPMLADGSGLGAAFTAMVVAATRAELRESGVLVPCEVISPDRALGPGELAQDPVDTYLAHTPGEQAILFAPSVESAIQFARDFRDRGIQAEAIYGAMPADRRASTIAAFKAGRIRVLTSVAVLTEGFNHTAASVCILARGVGHLGLYDQMVGRVLRASPGKTRAVVLDLTGATHVCGPPDEERRFSLEGRGLRRAMDVESPRFCPVCGSVVSSDACETCGYAGDLRKRKPRVLGLPMDRFARFRAQDDEQAAKTLGRWLGVAASKGYRPGWAFAKFSAVYGRAPTAEIKRRARSA